MGNLEGVDLVEIILSKTGTKGGFTYRRDAGALVSAICWLGGEEIVLW